MAAFVGPGTVTTAARAGAETGYQLLWTILFASIATIILQEMVARLGLVSRLGLGAAVRKTVTTPVLHWGSILLIVMAIGIGNIFYQTGNIVGAAVGLKSITSISHQFWSLVVGFLAMGLLALGAYRWIERVLVVLVFIMSLTFILTAFLVEPDWSGIFQGLLIPSFDQHSLAFVLGLIGTTIVPYNLFLHANIVREKWPANLPKDHSLREARWDLSFSVLLGGLITASILVTAATTFYPDGKMNGLADVAQQLHPTLGEKVATWCFAIGLFSAGLTSSITAPLAAAYAVCGAFGWKPSLRAWHFRGVWLVVLILGMLLAVAAGQSPAETILFAQVANALLLPLIAGFVLWAVNQSSLLKDYVNGWPANLLGGGVVLFVTALALYKFYTIINPN
ncbi:Divalent metal cation transporter MntH [Planctomycetales bacterium 10988]|nr:Divalent metal cation transporter MntH [Planctomycetales bacterium 10988]